MAGPGPDPDFGSLVGPYQAFRTGYPQVLFTRLLAAAPPGPLRVLDVATGTGLSVEGLVPRAARLVGVDIAAPMLRQAPVPHRALARAEALPFRAGAFDLVTCAQAFHWMDPPAALAEFHRVLAPGGLLAVWWKYDAADDPAAMLADGIVQRILGRADVHTPLARGGELPGVAASPFGGWEEQRFHHSVRHTVDSYVGYHGSREILRRSAGAQRGAVLAELERALRARHGQAPFEVRMLDRLCLLRKERPKGSSP